MSLKLSSSNYSITHARIRQFGGTSNVWAGWSGPLEEEDFYVRNWIEGSGWPISYSDLKPFYERLSLFSVRIYL